MKYLISLSFLLLLASSCSKEDLFSEQSRADLWLFHEGAKLPIVVEGNTQSQVFVILLHGGPGGTAQSFNAESKAFTNPLEAEYAMVYYDQRNAGLANGEWDEEKLTIEQHIEDLEKVIELLNYRYGDDIQIFLAGHSWGGYLGTSFLLDADRQSTIKAWINIDGLTNRNLNQFHVLDRIETIGAEQIANGVNASAWTEILNQVQLERDKSIIQYDVATEGPIFNLIRLAEAQIDRDNVLLYNANAVFSSIYSDNYDPFRIIITNVDARDRTLTIQMYDFDNTIDANLDKIRIPSLTIYGYYDVRTPIQQGEYFMNGIATLEADKNFIILNRSGHSAPQNESVELAGAMIDWIEKYR